LKIVRRKLLHMRGVKFPMSLRARCHCERDVIASEAKQSLFICVLHEIASSFHSPQWRRRGPDCFVSPLLAMT